MKSIRNLFDDDSAVSPVIGVILMVAITVILAAVIASFVLGLGDQQEPAPNPAVTTDVTDNELKVSVTGGDDFDSSTATLVVETDDGSNVNSIEVPLNADSSSSTPIISEVSAGDTFTVDTDTDAVNFNNEAVVSGDITGSVGNLANPATNDWEVELIYNPADGDSTVIYSDSS